MAKDGRWPCYGGGVGARDAYRPNTTPKYLYCRRWSLESRDAGKLACPVWGRAGGKGLCKQYLACGLFHEVFLKINGKTHYLWRAVDQHGNVLDILVQSRRNKAAAKKFFRKLLKDCQYVPRVIITDKLGSYEAAKKEVLPSVEHRRHKRLNNRAENSHQPTRQRERTMRHFTSAGHAQRFLAAFEPIREHFCSRRHRLKAEAYRQERAQRFLVWNEVSSLQIAA
jgi:hypothetical protein